MTLCDNLHYELNERARWYTRQATAAYVCKLGLNYAITHEGQKKVDWWLEEIERLAKEAARKERGMW